MVRSVTTTTKRTLFVTPDKDDLRTNTVTFTGAESGEGAMHELMGLHQRIRRAAADAAAGTAATGNSGGAGSITTTTSSTTKMPLLDEDKDEKKIIPKVSKWGRKQWPEEQWTWRWESGLN